MKHQFILPQSQQRMLDFLAQLDTRERYVVEVSEYKRKRSVEQNSRYWVILTHISEQLEDENGKKYSPEVWHEWAKAKFLGKDTILIDGDATLVPKSSASLKVMEFADFMTQIEAWAVDHNVKFFESLKEVG